MPPDRMHDSVYFRCTREDRARMKAAAKKLRLPLSLWLRNLAVAEAERVLEGGKR